MLVLTAAVIVDVATVTEATLPPVIETAEARPAEPLFAGHLPLDE